MGYHWTRTLKTGATGNDVEELQIRVAGWAANSSSKTYVRVDKIFGTGTKAAVKRFQSAYGLVVDGIVGPDTQHSLNNLESSNRSTHHFNWQEFHSKDGNEFLGGKVGSVEVKQNVRKLMYKLEALRKKIGDKPIIINSGFRSVSHNATVGGSSNSMHMYGVAADIAVTSKTPNQITTKSKTCGYSGIIKYATHSHCDSRIEHPYGSQFWHWPN